MCVGLELNRGSTAFVSFLTHSALCSPPTMSLAEAITTLFSNKAITDNGGLYQDMDQQFSMPADKIATVCGVRERPASGIRHTCAWRLWPAAALGGQPCSCSSAACCCRAAWPAEPVHTTACCMHGAPRTSL